MAQVVDHEFGAVSVRRSARARAVRLRIDHTGGLSACLPAEAPLAAVGTLINKFRPKLRRLIADNRATLRPFRHGQAIGSSHRLVVRQTAAALPSCRVVNLTIIVKLPASWDIESESAQTVIRQAANKALDKEARHYLPKRLASLAKAGRFSYGRLRFNNARSRWGSCSATGSIGLNVNLMSLPLELIDYVLLHELCHTRHMHHGPAFWQALEKVCPDFQKLKRELKTHQPGTHPSRA